MNRGPANDEQPFTNANIRMTGRLIAGARALVGISTADLAAACGLSLQFTPGLVTDDGEVTVGSTEEFQRAFG